MLAYGIYAGEDLRVARSILLALLSRCHDHHHFTGELWRDNGFTGELWRDNGFTGELLRGSGFPDRRV